MLLGQHLSTFGISKYESTNMTQAEFGRYPLQNKTISLALSHWIKLEQGTNNQSLNKAYNERTNDNHQWYSNI